MRRSLGRKMFVLVSALLLSAVFKAEAADQQFGYMKFDQEGLKKWKEADAKFARHSVPLKSVKRGALDLLPHFDYSATLRDQGDTGTCWAWATQAVMSIDLDVKSGVRLENGFSVQFIASNAWMIGAGLNSGGTAQMAKDFYEMNGYNIPWNNENAAWTDGDGENNTKSSWIHTTPNYPISEIAVATIDTFGESVSKEQAIANIKSVLDGNRPVWFAYFLATGKDWKTFGDFWKNQPETAIINLDFAQGHTYDKDGGGHAVACVGYNDDDPDPSKHYWIMLNSWGNADGGRPNGTFRIAMDTNYSAVFKDEGEDFQMLWWYSFDTSFTDVLNKGASLSFNMNNARENSDSIKISKCAYTGSDPASIFSAALLVNGFTFDLDASTGAWTQTSKGFTFKSTKKTKPEITLTVDTKKKTWTLSMGKASEWRYINPIEGLMFYLNYRETDGGKVLTLGKKRAFMLDEIMFKSSSNFKE